MTQVLKSCSFQNITAAEIRARRFDLGNHHQTTHLFEGPVLRANQKAHRTSQVAAIVFMILLLSTLCDLGTAAPAAYASAHINNSRTVRFPVSRYDAPIGTTSRERYEAYVDRRITRLQQSIEFQAPTTASAPSMNVSVYIRYFAPVATNETSNRTLRVWLARPAPALTDPVAAVTARNAYSSKFDTATEPSLERRLVLTCEVPSAATLGSSACPVTEHFCGVASIAYPSSTAALSSSMGPTQLLLMSITTDLVHTRDATQSASCTSNVEITAIWDNSSAIGVAFRRSVPETSNQTLVRPDVLINTGYTQSDAKTHVAGQFLAGSDPIGGLWTPLLADDRLRVNLPLGSFFSRFTLTNYSVASEALLTPTGVTCNIDDSLQQATAPNGDWEMSCVMPIKRAIFGQLSVRVPDALNATSFFKGVRFTLESTANLSIPARVISCTPQLLSTHGDPSSVGCRTYAPCLAEDVFLGTADGTNQHYTSLRMSWSPSGTGFELPIVADNNETVACNGALTATLFYTRTTSTSTTTSTSFASASCRSDQFECVNDQRCISNQQLCDSSRDCTDGSDEEGCERWMIIRTAGDFPVCNNAVASTAQIYINTYLTCLKTAQAYSDTIGGLRYIVDKDFNAECQYFHIDCVRRQSALSIAQNFTSTSPSSSIQTSVVVLQLEPSIRNALLNLSCNSIVTCSAKGDAVSINVATLGAIGVGCACTCYDGFAGSRCSVENSFTSIVGVWLELSGKVPVNAALVQTIQRLKPDVGHIWVVTAYYQLSDDSTHVMLNMDETSQLLKAGTGTAIASSLSISSASIVAVYSVPDVISTDEEHCTFDDTTRETDCTYFRPPGDALETVNVIVAAYDPLAVTTIHVTGYKQDGTTTISTTCTVPEMSTVPDLSKEFLFSQNPVRIQESWCPSETVCLLSAVPADTVAFRLNFFLPVGMNSTILAVRCGNVAHFDDATILPKLTVVPSLVMPYDYMASIDAYAIEESSMMGVIIVFGVFLVIAASSTALWCFCRKKDDNLMEVARSTAESKVSMHRLGLGPGEHLTDTFRWALRIIEKATRGPDVAWYLLPRRHIALWVTFTVLFVGLSAITLAYFFVAEPHHSSNYEVVLQYFRDSQCNASTADWEPLFTSFMPASGECEPIRTVGMPYVPVPRYYQATCTPLGTAEITHVELVGGFNTRSLCDAVPVTLPVESCILFGSTYVMARCDATTDLAAAKTYLEQMLPTKGYDRAKSIVVPLTQAAAEGVASASASEDDTVAGQRVPPFARANPFSYTDPLSGAPLQKYYYFDTATGTNRYSTTDADVGYMLSTAVGDTATVIGPDSVPRELLVSQSTNDLLSAELVTDIRAYEATIPDNVRFLPRTSTTDVPIGRFFNGYGAYVGVNATQSTDSSLWERLYYPGIMGQDSDIGADGEATIAFWLRAGRTSRGFPVASTDNIRTDESISPLLDRLQRMMISGTMDSASWFSDDWSVYWAVFVDGYSQRIHFVAAGPPGWNRVGFSNTAVFETVWDAQSLGLTRLFTNRWHHVALVVEVPANGDESGVGVGLLLRLVVDGETYSGSQGFLKCLPRQLDFITPIWDATIRDPQRMRITQGGTLVVGNINAGLYGVLVTSSAMTQADIIAMGTVPMNNFFNVNTAKFFALGFYVTFIAVSLLCMMSVGIAVEYISERRKRIMGESMAADLAYMSVVGVDITGEKFKMSGRDFRLIPVDTAKAMLGLENTIFATLLSEIEKLSASGDGAKADLSAIIWIRGQENYVPSTPQIAAMRDQFKTSEKSDLSHDGHFFIPQVLWNDFVEQSQLFWDDKLERREIDEEDLKKKAATGKKMQVKVAKVKVSKSGGKGAKGSKGAKGGRRGASMRKLSNSVKINGAAPMQMIQPVILSMQSAGSYLVNFSMPLEYQVMFANLFEFFKFQWLAFSLPDLFMALLLFGIGIGVTTMLFYFCISDHDEWLAFVGMYAAKRDRLDRAKIRVASEPPKTRSQRKQLLVALGNDEDLEDDDLFNDKYVGVSSSFEGGKKRRQEEGSSDDDDPQDTDTQAAGKVNDDDVGTPRTMPIAPIENWYDAMLRHILPLSITIPLDEYVDGSRRSNLIPVRKVDLQPAICPKKRMKWELEYDREKKLYVAFDADNRDAEPLPLMDVGYLCPLHRSILCEMEQRDACVRPYRCFAVLSGSRCTCEEGQMYCCRSRMPDGKFCPYSMCEVHFRSSASQFIKVSAKSGLMEIFGEGISNLLAFIAISLSSVIYFPVVQTCLQFLTCDPQYQCIFPHCWADADSSFLLAAMVVILMLAMVGVGMPAVLYWELHRRKKVLFAIFHRKEYFKVYLAVDVDAMEELEEREKQLQENMFASDRDDPTEAAGVFGFFAKFFSKAITGETIEENIAETHNVIHKSTVDFGEWERFLAGDNSALGQLLYKFIEYEYITLPPFLMLYRVAVLIPTVFVTDDMFTQMVALAAVEVGFGTFIFWTEPYINPWIDTMYRAGSVHNIMLIGLAAINTMLNAESSTLDLATLMLLVTGVYFLIVIFLLLMTTVWPTMNVALTKANVAKQMKRIGMRTIDMSSVVLNPLMHKKSLMPIVDLIRSYEAFVRAHPEAEPGDDLNRREDPNHGAASNMLPIGPDDCAPFEGGTVGEGLLGPLPGVPKAATLGGQHNTLNVSDYTNSYVPGGRRSKTPQNILEAVFDVVTGHDSDDPEEDLQDGEFDS